MLEPADTLGAYRLERQLGRGGMGTVFLAYDTVLHRQVALKVVGAADEAGSARARVLREARSAAALNHPNICTIHEVGEVGGTAFIAMEYVEGEPLSDRVGRGPLPIADVARFGTQTADALAFAHDRGVIHRDLKAANIIASPDGRVTIVDFGLARRIDASISNETTIVSMVAAGIVAGTPYAMAPEQVRGETVDARADIWALGVLLYEMGTGLRPFGGASTAEVFSTILRDQPPAVPASIPVPMREVILRCLAKDPLERYQGAGEVRDALAAIDPDTHVRSIAAVLPAISRRRLIVATACAAVVAAFAVAGLRGLLPTRTGGDAIKLAVLPIRNLTGDPAQEYFADGLTEEMITQLGRLHPRRLNVIARTSSMHYKSTDKPVSEIGGELAVDYVLEGSARREGGRVRISATLIRVSDQTQLWSDSFDRELSGILTLQTDVARGVASSLALTLLPEERAALATNQTVDPDAYEAVLRGRSHAAKMTRADLDTAERYFELALSKDPKAASAYAGLANVWSGRQQMQFVSPADAAPRLKAAAAKALELDNSLAEVHHRLALQYAWTDWNWSAADAAFRRAIALNANSPEAHAFYGHYLYMMKRPADGRTEMLRAMALDPLSDQIQSLYGTTLGFEHRFEEQAAQLTSALKTNPGSPLALTNLSEALHFLGRYDEALAAERARWAARGDKEADEALTRGQAEGGYRGAMLSLAETQAARARASGILSIAVAKLYARAGENERALDWLERAVVTRDPNLPYVGVGTVFEPLHTAPRFQQLLQRLNLPS
jgi:TolB-like protein/Tfp pilus assembly protein PilF/predicted Ser/Thr protein kinase